MQTRPVTPSTLQQKSALPVLTGNDLNTAINNYHLARSPIPSLFDADAIKKLIALYNQLDDKNKCLSTMQLLDVVLLLLRTNPAKDIVTSSVLSDLLHAFDCRVLGAIKAVLDLGGYNNGECLVDCLELMCEKPDDAQKISLAKSILFVLFALGTQSSLLNQYYTEINTDATLASNVFLAVTTLGNFGILFKNPQQAEEYFKEHMPANDDMNITNLRTSLFNR